jgi:hypothetical protein
MKRLRMKRSTVVRSAIFAVGLFVVVLSLTGHQAGAVQAPPAGNGDVNGDGEINLSDAVYLLTALFLGGPAPVPCRPPAGLPPTGQWACYQRDGTEVPCANATCPGQDGFYAAGCAAVPRFVDNADGTVTDTCTGLQWQQGRPDLNGDGAYGPADIVIWCKALSYCEGLVVAEYDDWRLPNLRELQSIVDYGRFDPAIDPIFAAYSDLYWSSTSNAETTGDVWYVNFRSVRVLPEDDLNDDKPVFGYVRAVRNAR